MVGWMGADCDECEPGYGGEDCDQRLPSPAPPVQAGGPGHGKHSDCESCVAAGFGWSLKKSKCGGFKNAKCPRSGL
jgi:hypothetical protein